MIGEASLLVSGVCGGTIVPLAYRIYVRHADKGVDRKRVEEEINDIATHTARESVEAVKGAVEVLRDQLRDGRAENAALKEERAAERIERDKDREEIARLRRRIRELTPAPASDA